MFTIKQSYNQMKYVQHYLWDGILFLLVSWTASSRVKKSKGGSHFSGPGLGYHMSEYLYHQPTSH